MYQGLLKAKEIRQRHLELVEKVTYAIKLLQSVSRNIFMQEKAINWGGVRKWLSVEDAESLIFLITFNLGTPLPTASLPASAHQGPVMLTAKNLQCMRAILSVAHCYGNLLGSSWHIILTVSLS